MANFVDLTGSASDNSTGGCLVDLYDDSSDEEELKKLFDPSYPSIKAPVIVDIVDLTHGSVSSTEYSSDDDSSLGMGNAYGEFSPLFDMKISIAKYGYLDFNGIDSKSLAEDSWYLEQFNRGMCPALFSKVDNYGTTFTQRIPQSVTFQR